MTINNSTFSRNVALGSATSNGGGAINQSTSATASSVTINNSTLVYNSVAGSATGGGIRRNTTVGFLGMTSTILAANVAASGPDFSYGGSSAGTVTIDGGGNNLVGVVGSDTASGRFILNGSNNKTGSPGLTVMIGNHGGTTLTHKALPGSAALDSAARSMAKRRIKRGPLGLPIRRSAPSKALCLDRMPLF